MSDAIRHECGLAYIRLLKPLAYYHRKYGTAFYGLNKLYLLMEKQHNRGQDGAGIATLKLNITPGHQFLYRQRQSGAGAISRYFSEPQQRGRRNGKDVPGHQKPSGPAERIYALHGRSTVRALTLWHARPQQRRVLPPLPEVRY